jgi:hypothetical protein
VGNGKEKSSLGLVIWDLLVADFVHQKSIVHDATEVLAQSAQLKYLGQRQVSKDRTD